MWHVRVSGQPQAGWSKQGRIDLSGRSLPQPDLATDLAKSE